MTAFEDRADRPLPCGSRRDLAAGQRVPTAKVSGYGESELANKSLQDLIHPDDVAPSSRRSCRVRSRTARRARRSITGAYTRTGGCWTLIFGHVTLVRDESGEPMYFISLLEDHTERHRAELRWNASGALVETSQDAIFSTDVDGHVNSWNPHLRAALRPLGRRGFRTADRVVTRDGNAVDGR